MVKNNLNSGILLIDKPMFKTSNKIILDVRRKLNLKKVGHAGTLDPLATGLIVMLVNNATKLSDYLLTSNKEYEVKMKLFIQTNTDDILGNIRKTKNFKIIPKKDLVRVFDYFNDFTYEQYPPIYSAIKYNGRKLYEYARKNIDIKIKPRKITINKLVLKSYDKKIGLISFYVKSSKGTYVRSLVKDIANKLNTIATVYELRRVASGNFNVANSFKIEDIETTNLISMYDALVKNNFILLQHDDEQAIKNGRSINLINHNEDIVFIVNKNNEILAIYKHMFDHKYKCIRGI